MRRVRRDLDSDCRWDTKGFVKLRRGLLGEDHAGLLANGRLFQLFVILVMNATYSDGAGIVAVSIRGYSKKLGCSRCTVRENLERLSGLGYITPVGLGRYIVRRYNGAK